MITNQNTLSNPKDIIKSANNFMKNFTPRRQLPKLVLLNFLAKFLTKRKYIRIDLSFFEAKISLDDIIKSINSHANNKVPGNDSLTAEFYILFSNKLAPFLLDVYDSRGKLGTMSATYRTGIIFAIYKKGDAKDIENYGPISLLKLIL